MELIYDRITTEPTVLSSEVRAKAVQIGYVFVPAVSPAANYLSHRQTSEITQILNNESNSGTKHCVHLVSNPADIPE